MHATVWDGLGEMFVPGEDLGVAWGGFEGVWVCVSFDGVLCWAVLDLSACASMAVDISHVGERERPKDKESMTASRL